MKQRANPGFTLPFTVDALGVGKKQDARGASDWVA